MLCSGFVSSSRQIEGGELVEVLKFMKDKSPKFCGQRRSYGLVSEQNLGPNFLDIQRRKIPKSETF